MNTIFDIHTWWKVIMWFS